MKTNYIFLVWCSTIVAAPILMMLATAFLLFKKGNTLDAGAFGFISFAIAYGFVLSIPTCLIAYFLFYVLSKRGIQPERLKFILWLIGIICILITFYLLYGNNAYNISGNYAALSCSVTYTLCLTIFSFLFRIS